jgi:hypothetical protein
MINLVPEQAQIEARRPDGTTWRFGPPPDAMLFFENGERFPLDFAPTLSKKIHGGMRTIIDQINLRDIAQSLESRFVVELTPFGVKIDDVEHRFFVRCETPTGAELHEIVCVKVRGKAKIDVHKVDLAHSKLGEVHVATGDFKLGDHSGSSHASQTHTGWTLALSRRRRSPERKADPNQRICAASQQQQGRSEAGREGSHPSCHRRGGSGIEGAAQDHSNSERVREHVPRGFEAEEQAVVCREQRDDAANAHPAASW